MKTGAAKLLSGIAIGMAVGGFVLLMSASEAKLVSGYIVMSAAFIGACILAGINELKTHLRGTR